MKKNEVLASTQKVKKDGNKLNRNTRILIVLNLIMAFAFFVSFFGLFYLKQKQEYEAVRDTQANNVRTMTNQFGSYMMTQDMIIAGYGGYISNEGLSFEETLSYLKHWVDFYVDIALVEIEGDSVYVLLPGDTNVYEKKVSELGYLEALKKNYKQNEVCFTESFKTKDGQSAVGLYSEITVEGSSYLMVFDSTYESIKQASMNVEGLNGVDGILLDKEYTILQGRMGTTEDASGIRYFDEIKNSLGQEAVDKAINELQTSGSTYLEVYNAQKKHNDAAFLNVIPGTDRWTYVYYLDTEEFMKSSKPVFAISIFILAFISCWIILEFIILRLYNQNTRNYLAALDEQNEELQKANVAKSAFVSNMSHEIRTPINAVLGMDEMILRECKDETILGYATDIQRSGRTLLGIINDVLDFSKIESGKLEIIPSQYDITEVIKDVYRMISLRAKNKYLQLEMEISEKFPTLMYGDDIRVKQCIVNLLTNAVKYTEKGSVTLTMDCHKLSEESVEILVAVTDTGIGMKEEEMEKLFTPYERLDAKRNRTVEGTGLGLPLVVRLLEMMDSKLEVESTYGKGSTFSFRICQKIVDATPLGKINYEMRDIAKIYEPTLYAPLARILIVDDLAMNLRVAAGLLKPSAMQIDTAGSGKNCLALASNVAYDLILLDHRMPGMDGIETLHTLKEMQGPNLYTPVIALTANVISGARENYQAEGFADFLAKPIDTEQLENILKKYLPKSKVMDRRNVSAAMEEQPGKLTMEKVMDPENIRVAQERIAAMKEREAAQKQAEDAEKEKVTERENKSVRMASVIKQPAPVHMSIRDALKESSAREEEFLYEEYIEEADVKEIPTAEEMNLPAEIDFKDAVTYCGSEELALEVIGEFKEDAPLMLTSLKESFVASDIENFTMHAHSIKSTAKTIGAKEVAEDARILEVMGKAGNISSAQAKVDILEKHLVSLCEKL